MTSAKVTGKGQTTIPADVRDMPGLRSARGYEIHSLTASIKDLKGVVPPPAQPASIDEMNDAIAAAADPR